MINSVENSSLINLSLHSETSPSVTHESISKKSVKSNSGTSLSEGVKQGSEYGKGIKASSSDANSSAVKDDSNVIYLNKNKDTQNPEEIALLGQKNDGEEQTIDYGNTDNSLSFDSIAAEIGVGGTQVNKEQLFAYLQSLMSDSSKIYAGSREMAFVRNLIAKFDTISGGEEYININSLDSAQVGTEPLPGSKDGTISTFELRA